MKEILKSQAFDLRKKMTTLSGQNDEISRSAFVTYFTVRTLL